MNEEPTIGSIVATLASLREVGLIDEVLVIDSGSVDRTREVAAGAGAEVILDYEVLPELGKAEGKGEAIFKGIAASAGELICWLDADVTDFSERFVLGLIGPLLCHPPTAFVKAYYKRPLATGLAPGTRSPQPEVVRQQTAVAPGATHPEPAIGEGGRVTELTARPLLAHLFPALASVSQPLSGEYAGRRWLFEQISLDSGYGVDVGILIDVFLMIGLEQMAECDLEIRHHRNRPLSDLAPMAAEVSYAILRRVPALRRALVGYARPMGYSGVFPKELRIIQRPPIASLRREVGESGL